MTPRWKWRLRLALFAFAVVLLLDCIAISLGFSLQTSVDQSTAFEGLMFYVNFLGIVTLLVFGDPLANPLNQSVHQWNLFCFMAGGLASCALIALFIGWLIDRRRNAIRRST